MGWRWTQTTFDTRLKQNPNLIYWTESGRPRYKRYADNYRGRKIGNLWKDFLKTSAESKNILELRIFKRIIAFFSNPNDKIRIIHPDSNFIQLIEEMNRTCINIE